MAAAWLRRERGRPATLSTEGLLAGLFLVAADNRGAVALTRVTDTLYFEISPRMHSDRGFEAAYAVVRRRFHALLAACDPSPLPKNKRLPRAEAAKLTAETDPALLAERRARLARLTGLIIEDSLEPVHDLLEQHWDGSAAVDGTAVRVYSKGLRSSGPVTTTDPDAA